MLSAEEHLERMSGVLRHQIGPAVSDPFPRTQAFMASVVLQKLARQLATASARAEADQRDVAELRAELLDIVTPSGPVELMGAVEALDQGPAGPALSRVVAALYTSRDEVGPDTFDRLLGRVRRTLRARLDRQLEYSA